MKFTTSKKLDSSLLGERVIKEYSFTDSTSESNDRMRRGYNYTVHCKVFGTIENETRNEDGTYTYDYSSRVLKDHDQYGDGYRKPSESKYDLSEMVEELLFKYNIHEFSTELQEEPNNIKDYYAAINANSTYQKNKEPYFSYSWSTYSKDREDYTKSDNTLWSSYEKIKSESIEDINAQLNGTFSKDDYILYLMGNEVKKTYQMNLGLDEIGENETVRNFLGKMSLEPPKFSDFENALQENVISMEDIKNCILKHNNLSAKEIPPYLLEQLFSEDKELISHFNEREMPIDILRKYSPNFDITKVSPSDLKPSDLDNVLQNVIQTHCILGIYNGSSKEELQQGYLEYLHGFYDNPDALRKIIPVINTSPEYFFASQAEDFISQISPEVLEPNEIRDILLDTKNIALDQLLKYQLDYDTNSAKKLMDILSNTTSRTSLKDINSVLNILQQNGISNDEILQALRINGFNINISSWQEDKDLIQEFKSLGIEGITLDDLRDSILKYKDFNFIKLTTDIKPEEMTREYNSLLNELSEKKGKKNGKDAKRYEEIFELMCDYSNATELFSKLAPEVKNLTKKLMIENLDVIETLQKNPIGYSSGFSKVMKVMTQSFEISEEDMTNIYMKCLNNGVSKEEALSALQQYMPEEERKSFEERINSANIYPNPKYFWLADKNLRRIRVNRGENRNTIKSKIQADGRCFSTRLKTDMTGESKEGKKIAVNNLSKWLFGVPGVRGNLTITRAGDYIQLPGNTPDEAVELIKSILQERTMEAHSK